MKSDFRGRSEPEKSVTKYLLLISAVILLSAGVRAQENSPEMSKLGFISGCWRSDDKVQILEALWTKPDGQSMLGVGRTIRNGKTDFYEFLQIREGSDGIVYISEVNSGKPVSFKLVKVNDNQAIFENLQNEFPRRIIYQRVIDGSLVVSFEGMESGKEKRVDFGLKRMRCD
jgi:Domain of unknown function (DUF6265)